MAASRKGTGVGAKKRAPAKRKTAKTSAAAKRKTAVGGLKQRPVVILVAAGLLLFVVGLLGGAYLASSWGPAEQKSLGAVQTAPPVVKPQPPTRKTTASEPTPPPAVPRTAVEEVALAPPPQPWREERAPWRKNAVAVAGSTAGKPMVAIVLDDLGVDRTGAQRAIALPGPLTLAFMTYAEDLSEMSARATANGHELMVHMPMEPENLGDNDPGPNVLLTDHDAAQLRARLEWGLARFEGYVGVNNHMGSRFTSDAAAMRLIMAELKDRGLLFLDSRTIASTVAPRIAQEVGLPFAERDVFLDHEPTLDGVRTQLALLEETAREQGYAIAIGHPKDWTLSALEAWLPEMEARGLKLVPLSAIVARLWEKRAAELRE